MPQRKRRVKVEAKPAPKIFLSEEQKTRIEKAYGFKIADWWMIEAYTNLYLAESNEETWGAPIADIRKTIKEVVLSAWSLRVQFPKPDQQVFRDGLELNYEQLTSSYLTSEVPKSFGVPEAYLALGKALDTVIALGTFAAREINDPDNQAESPGTGWEQWIRLLTLEMDRLGLTRSARKDTDKSSKTSPFVLFVKHLQEALPFKFRKFTHSDFALAQAINRARKYSDK